MTVSAAQVAATSEWGLTEDKDGKKTVTVPYYVTSDDLEDGPLTVLGATGLPAINSTLNAGNDTDTSLFCVGRTPTKVDDKSGQWVVSCQFSTEGNEQRQDDQGNATDDPEDWQPDIAISSVGFSRPIKDAVWVEQPNVVIPGRGNGEKGPIINSAGQTIFPIPQMDDARQRIEFTKYWSFLGDATFELYAPSVNSDQFDITKYYNGNLVFFYAVQPGQAKIDSISSRFEIHTVGGVPKMFNRVSISVDINRDGWNHKELDRGPHAKAEGGDPDGKCGEAPYISGGPDFQNPGDACEGTAPLRVIHGVDGLPVVEANLNGNGKVLNIVNQGVELEYRTYPERVMGFLFKPPA